MHHSSVVVLVIAIFSLAVLAFTGPPYPLLAGEMEGKGVTTTVEALGAPTPYLCVDATTTLPTITISMTETSTTFIPTFLPAITITETTTATFLPTPTITIPPPPASAPTEKTCTNGKKETDWGKFIISGLLPALVGGATLLMNEWGKAKARDEARVWERVATRLEEFCRQLGVLEGRMSVMGERRKSWPPI